MGDGNALPYLTRLRIFARRAGYFYHRLSKLDTVYDDCPAICRSPYADPQNGCPDCEYTNAVRVFRKEYEGELAKEIERRLRQSVTGDTPPAKAEIDRVVERELKRRPLFDDLVADYSALCEQEEAVGVETAEQEGGYNPLWTVRTAEGIRIIRAERRKVRRDLKRDADRELDARLRAKGLIT